MKVSISKIFIYPVKSLGSLELASSVVERRGLRSDRRFMIVRPDGNFVTQREIPKLATIKVDIEDEEIVLRREGAEVLKLLPPDTSKNDSENIEVNVWKSRVNAIVSTQTTADKWLKEFTGQDLRVVYMPDAEIREVNEKFRVGEDIVGFADAYPILLVNEASLSVLNQKLPDAVPIDRFRPNLVVEGLEPFAEDRLSRIRIGDTLFRVAKPCVRCVVTTIDQESGEKQVREPLGTLASFRSAKQVFPDRLEKFDLNPNDVLFGVYLIPEEVGGCLRAGDRVVGVTG